MNSGSPCIRDCRLDRAGICLGCFRTLGEIAGWMLMSEGEKAAVITASKQRSVLRPILEKYCAQCGTSFHCGPVHGATRCWCEELPSINPPKGSAYDCLCSSCLKAAILRAEGNNSITV